MAFDELLANRVRLQLVALPGFSEKRMFGGLCFLIGGHMTAGIVGSTLMLRVGPERYSTLLTEPHAREMNFTGRPLKGMIYVDPAGVRTDRNLSAWLERAVSFVLAQPPKRAGSQAPPRGRVPRGRGSPSRPR